MSAPSFAEVLDILHEIAPLELAAEWDNVGLLLQPHDKPKAVARVLLAIDLTEAVIDEAAAFKADLVVAYHPPIFRPLGRLSMQDATQRRILRALQAGLPVYSPHTALDAAPGGLADWLIEGALGDAVPTEVHTCGEGDFGRVAMLDKGIAWTGLLARLKDMFGVKFLQVAKPAATPRTVRSIAVAAGAGSGVLRGARADVYVTGEMSHHDVLAATASGAAVVLAGHSNTERGFLKLLRKHLTGEFGKALDVRVSKSDRDPLTIV